MKEFIALTLFFATMGIAHADGPGYVFDDPHVEPPECRILFGLLPCHVRQGGNDPLVDGPKIIRTPTLSEWMQGTNKCRS